jgi:hypothetical protein
MLRIRVVCRRFGILTFSIPVPGSRIPDLGFQISDLGSRIPDPGSRIPDRGSRISDLGSRIPDRGSWIRISGSRIQREKIVALWVPFCSHKFHKLKIFHFLTGTLPTETKFELINKEL